MRFTDEELERYGRQIVLPEIGGIGQERLRGATVLLVGAGGLGAPAALYLAAAGIGRLAIVDDDAVALGNLQRQVLYAVSDIGRSKAEAARERLAALNPLVEVVPHAVRIGIDNAAELCRGADVVLDGSDNFATRRLVAEAAAATGRPLVSGSVQGFAGQLTLLAPFARRDAPCFRCLFAEAPPPNALPSCAMGGILGPVAGLVGTMMTTEALKWLLGMPSTLIGELLLIDGVEMQFDRIRVARRQDCDGPCRLEAACQGVSRDGQTPLAPVAGDH